VVALLFFGGEALVKEQGCEGAGVRVMQYDLTNLQHQSRHRQ